MLNLTKNLDVRAHGIRSRVYTAVTDSVSHTVIIIYVFNHSNDIIAADPPQTFPVYTDIEGEGVTSAEVFYRII